MVLIDSNGIAWFCATGQQGVIAQSRDQSNDDRWSGNVTGVGRGYETTMIAKSIGIASGGHFASKLFGGNHSGSGASSQRWYDLGVRSNGDVQLQWEGPHPSNHDFSLPSSKNPITNIGVGLEGRWIGLKWLVYKKIPGGSPANGGVRCMMWVNTDCNPSTGAPNNSAWRLCIDFIDGIDANVISPQSFQAPDECDLEIRRSDTDDHEIYKGGQHWRKLSAQDIAAFEAGGSGTTNPPPPPGGTPNDVIDGIKMIYPPKEDGQSWFLNNNPEGDGQLISDSETITRTSDYFTASTTNTVGTRYIRVLTEFGDPGLSCEADYGELAEAGTSFTGDDWKNVEMTIVLFPQEAASSADLNTFGLIARSGSSISGPSNCCGEYDYRGVLELASSGTLAGQTRFNKNLGRQVPTARLDNVSQTVKSNFFRSWTGVKLIVYNVKGPNNEDWVTLELWLCPSDSATDLATNWTKVNSFIDKGNNWGSGGNICGGTSGQAISWGSAEVGIFYRAIEDLRWKKWSVREIDPFGQWPSDPDTDPPDPCDDPNNNPPPPPPPPSGGSNLPLYRFISWGDNDTTNDATDVLDRIFTETNVSQYLFAGDGPYASSADDWTDMMDTYFSTPALKGQLMLAQGNHDHNESESNATEADIEAWFPGLSNSNEGLEWLQQKKVGNAYIIVMNSQDPNIDVVNGAQYNYVQNALNTAKQLRTSGQIDWIITMVHKSWFNLLGSNPSYVTVRHAYAAMFLDAQVDFMFHGHNHSYAIWRPIVAIPGNDDNTDAQQLFTMASDGTTYDLSKQHGAFYIINGNGGHEINNWGEDPADFPNVIYANDDDFGYTVLDIQGKQATVKAKDVDGTTLFTVQATRGTDSTTNPPPPPPDEEEDDDDECGGTTNPPPPPPPIESLYNDLTIIYNINSDSDGCLCNDPGFTPPPPPDQEEPCPSGQHRNSAGVCVDDDPTQPPPPPPPPGGQNQAIYNVRFDGSGSNKDYKMGDENSSSYYKKWGSIVLGDEAPVYGEDLKRIEWAIAKVGNPTGNATIVIRDEDNTIRKTLGTINVQNVTNSFQTYGVENTGSTYNIVEGDRILIEYTGGDEDNYIIVRSKPELQNDMKVTRQSVENDDDEWDDTDREACFVAYA